MMPTTPQQNTGDANVTVPALTTTTITSDYSIGVASGEDEVVEAPNAKSIGMAFLVLTIVEIFLMVLSDAVSIYGHIKIAKKRIQHGIRRYKRWKKNKHVVNPIQGQSCEMQVLEA